MSKSTSGIVKFDVTYVFMNISFKKGVKRFQIHISKCMLKLDLIAVCNYPECFCSILISSCALLENALI